MFKLGELIVHTPKVFNSQTLIVEAKKITHAKGFSDSERKKLVDLGFKISNDSKAFAPLGMTVEDAKIQLAASFRDLEPSGVSKLEKDGGLILFPKAISIEGEIVSPLYTEYGGVQSIVIPKGNHKVDEFFAEANYMSHGENAFILPADLQSVQELVADVSSVGKISSNVNIDLIQRAKAPQPKLPPVAKHIVLNMQENGQGRILFIPNNSEFSASEAAELNIRLNHKLTPVTLNAGQELNNLSENGLPEPFLIKEQVSAFSLPVSTFKNQKNKKGEVYEHLPEYIAFPLSPVAQKMAAEKNIYDLQRVPPVSVSQVKDLVTGNLQSSFDVITTPELKDYMTKMLTRADLNVDRATKSIGFTGIKNGTDSYAFRFANKDANAVFDNLKGLLNYQGKLTPEQKYAEPTEMLSTERQDVMSVANEYYRSFIGNEADVLALVTGQINTPFTDRILGDIESNVEGLRWQETINSGTPTALDGSNVYVFKKHLTKCSYNDQKGDKDMVAYITINSQDLTATISTKKSGKHRKVESSYNIGNSITPFFQQETEKRIADVALGGDYSKILAREEKEREMIAESMRVAAKRQAKHEAQQKQLAQDDVDRFKNEYRNADRPLSDSKELKRKGLSGLSANRPGSLLRLGTKVRSDNTNLQLLLAPYTNISANPELDNRVGNAQRIIHDGSSNSAEKRYLTGQSRTSINDTLAIYQTSPINESYNQYVVAEGVMEAEWLAGKLNEAGMHNVWVGAAGDSGAISETLQILEKKYPGSPKTILADNDSFKIEAGNTGLAAVYDSAISIMQSGKSVNHISYWALDNDAFKNAGIRRTTDATDITKEAPPFEIQKKLNALGVDGIKVITERREYTKSDAKSVAATSNRNQVFVPDDASLNKVYNILNEAPDGAIVNIPHDKAQELLSDVLFRDFMLNQKNLNNELKGENPNPNVKLSSLMIEKARYLSPPVKLNLGIQEFKMVDGKPELMSEGLFAPTNDDGYSKPLVINDESLITPPLGSGADKPYLPPENEREHYVSKDFVVTEFKEDVGKHLRGKMKDGDTFRTAVPFAYEINNDFESHVNDFIKLAVEIGTKNDIPSEKLFGHTKQQLSSMRKTYMNSLPEDYSRAMRGFVRNIENDHTVIFGVDIGESVISPKSQASLDFIDALEDPDKFNKFVDQRVSFYLNDSDKVQTVQDAVKKTQQERIKPIESFREKSTGKKIMEAIEGSPDDVFYFPLKGSNDLLQVQKDYDDRSQYKMMRYRIPHGAIGEARSISVENVIKGQLNDHIAGIPISPTAARDDAIILAQQNRALTSDPKLNEALKVMTDTMKKGSLKDGFSASERDGYVNRVNWSNTHTGVHLANGVVGKHDHAETWLKIPALSFDENFLSKRGQKVTVEDAARETYSKVEAELNEVKSQGLDPAVIQFHQDKLDKVKQQYQSALDSGVQKSHHTDGVVGRSVAVFPSDIAFVKSKPDGNFDYAGSRQMGALGGKVRAFTEGYEKLFAHDMPKSKKEELLQRMSCYKKPIDGLTVDLDDPKMPTKPTPYVSVPKDLFPLVRMIGHETMSGSTVQAYKVPNAINKYTEKFRIYRANTPKQLEKVMGVIDEINQKISARNQQVGQDKQLPTINYEQVRIKASSYEMNNAERFGVDANGTVLFGVQVERKCLKPINKVLNDNQLMSLVEFEHLEQPAHNKSPYMTAAQMGYSEVDRRSAAWEYAQNPPSKLSEDDPLEVSKSRAREIERQQREKLENQQSLELPQQEKSQRSFRSR